jgi:hypothetical protein
VGSENFNPLDELNDLGQQVDRAPDLAALKPIYFRVDQLSKEHSSDFEVQLLATDIKQRLISRGTLLKQQGETVRPSQPPELKPASQAAIPHAETPQVRPPIAIPPVSKAPVSQSTTVSQARPTDQLPPPLPTQAKVPPPARPPEKRPPPLRPPVGSRTNWKRAVVLGALAGALASIALIAVLVNQARKRNRGAAVAGIQVQIATTPPGANVRIASGAQANPETTCTSDCNLALAPGTYQVTAFLDGYEPAANNLTVTAGLPAMVSLTLAPQAQSVRILTDLDQGKVSFDDQPPADLQEGQFVVDKVAPGPHKIRVVGKNGDASLSFEIADARMPVVAGPVSTRNLTAVLISSLGSQGRVVTSSGPMKLALNGQPQGDAGPAGIDVKGFEPGVDEIVVGEGKDQRNMKESFGPAPMLTVFLKSDVNMGTLIVSTGEDDVHVFLNDKEYQRRTQRGQVRIATLGKATVRVAKDGFQVEPPQMAEVKKGAEVRLEFKLKPMPQLSVLQIRGGTAGAEVLIDQKDIGTVGGDGNFTFTSVAPGDHNIEIRREQYVPKRLQRTFRAGQSIALSGADVVLAAASGSVKLTRTPPGATVSYRRADENEFHEVAGNQIELPAGNYIFQAKAPGFADHTERLQVTAGEPHSLEFALARERIPAVAPPPASAGGMDDFEDPSAWRKDGDLWVHKGSGFIPFKLPPKGVFTFTVELLKGGNLFRGGRIRWCVQYLDAKNYLLFELDRKTFWTEVIEKGKKFERNRTQHDLATQKAFTIQIESSPDRLVHKVRNGDDWIVLDSFSEPGRDFTKGKFGFLIQGSDEIGISDFKFTPK